MSVLWTVVLLNSLLIPSQGFVIPSLVSRADMNGKCIEKTGFILLLWPVLLLLSLDHAQKNRRWSRSPQQ